MSDRIKNIQLLRVFSILSVVAFHVYQMTYTGEHLQEDTRKIFEGIYFIPISCWLINIAMPLFMTISGYLFFWLLAKGKYKTWSNMLKKKALRIIVPYFVFAVIMMCTTNNFRNVAGIFTGYWHLWFLPVLMWCFVIIYALKDFMHNRYFNIAVLLISFIIMHVPNFMPKFFGLHILPGFFYWFVLGCIMAIYKDKISGFVRKTRSYYIMFVIAIIIGVIWPTEYGEEVNLLFSIGQTFMVMALWYITEFMNLEWIDHNPIINEIAWNSFGLYIFHNWMALYLIGNASKRIFGIETFAPAHPYLYPFLFFTATLCISFVLSWGLRRTKIGRWLLG